MSARIRSLRNGLLVTALDEVSRDDLALGDVVSVQALDAASTYNWAIAFAPEGSTATFSGSASAASPGTFTVDLEGPYLIRLTVNVGDPSEDTQYVRLRALTEFGGLTLVAAGERRDNSGTIPVDVDVEGWANEQNANIQTLKEFIKPLVSSGRLLYVDANDGTSNYADYSSIQDAISAASSAGAGSSEQWIVAVRPGRYSENVAFEPWIHVMGWPGNPDGQTSESVVLEGIHTVATSSADHRLLISNLHIENNADSTSATLTKSGLGTLRLFGVRVESNGTNVAQGAAVHLTGGTLEVRDSTLLHTSSGGAGRVAFFQSGNNTSSRFEDSRITGPSGLDTNPSTALVVGVSTTIVGSRIVSTHASGVGASSMAQDLTVERSDIDTLSGVGISINPSATVYAGPVGLTVRYTHVATDITFDTTNLVGTTTLNMGAVEYQSLNLPGGAVTAQNALTQAKTHFYDDTATALGADNVQDAIDLLAGGVVGNWAATLAIGNTSGGTNPELTSGDVLIFGDSPAASVSAASEGRIRYNDATTSFQTSVDGGAWADIGTGSGGGSPFIHKAVPPLPNNTWRYEGWTPIAAVVGDFSVAMDTVNTQGNYTVTVTNETTAQTMLVGASFDMNTLVAGAVTPLTLTGTLANLTFAAGDQWSVEFVSDDLAFDGDGIYWSMLFGTTGSIVIANAPDDNEQFEITIFPANTINTLWFPPYACEVVGVKVYAETVPTTAGVYTLAVEDLDNSNNLLSAVTFDLTSLSAATLTSVTLTGTPADLLLATGTRVRFQLISDNGDLVATGIYAQIIYRSQ